MKTITPNIANNAAATLGEATNPLLMIVVILLVMILMASVLTFTISRLRRRSVERQGQLPADELQRWRTALVEQVGEASQTQGAQVTLREFWKGTRLSNAQRYVVLKDLLDRQILYPAYAQDGLFAFCQRLRWHILHLPVAVVRLSDQHWQRLASGASAGIVANGGDVIVVRDSPGAGVVSRSHGANQEITQAVTPAFVQLLSQALREDAQALAPGHPLRERAESFADTLERDATANRWQSVKSTASDVLAFAANSTALWAATLAILAVH